MIYPPPPDKYLKLLYQINRVLSNVLPLLAYP